MIAKNENAMIWKTTYEKSIIIIASGTDEFETWQVRLRMATFQSFTFVMQL